jgi:hypothetical protein
MGALKQWMINHSEEVAREEGYRLRMQEEDYSQAQYEDEIMILNTQLLSDVPVEEIIYPGWEEREEVLLTSR